MVIRRMPVLAALLAWLTFFPARVVLAEPVRIGVDIPLTGAAADIGNYLLWGVEIALEEANREGGALGRAIEATILDDETSPDKAAENATRLIGQDKVAAVLGPANSGNALAIIPLMQQARKPLMLLTASATKLTLIYRDAPENYIFRATLPDREQIRALIAWASGQFSRIAIACDTTPYGQLARQDMVDLLAEKGLSPVAVVQFDQGDLDMTAQARELSRTPAEAVAVLSLSPEVAAFVRSADAVGYRPRFIGQYPFFLRSVKDLPVRLSNGLTGVLGSAPEDSPKARELDHLVRSRYRHEGYYPFKFVEAAYEGAKITVQAIRAAGSEDGEAIRRALESLERFEGVSRVFEHPYSKDRHELYRAENLSIGVWQDGAIRRLEK
ncbi:ABC transporter substrate-binding protein [Fundidesulfovibrio terrae]|uniref:ABC transporter substrate-binding protein n=1 Tax=Fundidesulfovibrio terrae TaxID=2922866 RepID=UPI001FB01036|nr:ABC transporter substrate-binding protein [Fundidesulfovibrio terrae]